MKHIVIYMYIKAVTKSVKLRLYLWNDIYNIFLKIEQILYYCITALSSALPPSRSPVQRSACAPGCVIFVVVVVVVDVVVA